MLDECATLVGIFLRDYLESLGRKKQTEKVIDHGEEEAAGNETKENSGMFPMLCVHRFPFTIRLL